MEVYSNCEEVELLLNGKSLGSKPLPADASPRNWRVRFGPGTLKAVWKKGVGWRRITDRGKAGAVVLVADRPSVKADWDDVAYVTAR